MRVVTWNVWWRFGDWTARQPAIAATLRAARPDVVCLQEVWGVEDGDDQADVLAEALGGFHVARTRHRWWKGRSFGNAILSRWPILHRDELVLPGADGEPGHRRVVHALVDAPHGRVPVFCTHLNFRFDESTVRQDQVRAMAEWVADHRGDPEHDHPAVLGGDFNAVPTSDEMRMLTGEAPPPVPDLVFTDCWAAVGDGPGHTWSPDNPHLADAYWPRRRLDHVLVSWPRPKPLGNPVRAELIGTDPVDGIVPSDHYGVVVDLRDG